MQLCYYGIDESMIGWVFGVLQFNVYSNSIVEL